MKILMTPNGHGASPSSSLVSSPLCLSRSAGIHPSATTTLDRMIPSPMRFFRRQRRTRKNHLWQVPFNPTPRITLDVHCRTPFAIYSSLAVQTINASPLNTLHLTPSGALPWSTILSLIPVKSYQSICIQGVAF
ncbi:hypothetical protein JAAARDRAFT_539379 [Jaapia argillacea MUCL 33604]|uniref:Uncharacterized protein n=1 Tax=Jaapia argillacea MUCL 33604 TaxID=933084 RepID=A0A067PJG0_9AGAM|nr:hypothetical protein JAAARDRAFT_539379 [Jaapia argillacea MUCL 33604]